MADLSSLNLVKGKKRFKILSIDGGGIKGLYSAEVLAKFEEIYQCRISDHFDLICGTSTGGIIALGISLGIPMSDICKFYTQHGPRIFCADKQRNKWGRRQYFIKQLLGKGKYSQKDLEDALYSVFKDKKICESNNLLCIPAYNITTAEPRIFKKDYENLTEDDSKRYVDIALATAAAPTYFPVKETNNHCYIDGGVWANNPTLVGLTEYIFKISTDPNYRGVDILSISSIVKPTGERHGRKERSFRHWGSKLFDSYTVGQSFFTDFFLKQLINVVKFPMTYLRVQHKPLSVDQMSIIDMDTADKNVLKLLTAIGQRTGIDYKDDPTVKAFFSTPKTYSCKNE